MIVLREKCDNHTNEWPQLCAENRGSLEGKVSSLSEKKQFLAGRANGLEAELRENRQALQLLDEQKAALERQAAKSKPEQTLARKKFADLGVDAVNKTKAAYKQKIFDDVNSFGKNRGLVVDKLVLRDENGRTLEVNQSRANTYENLNDEERKRVTKASAWKDQKRISDAVYSSLCNVGQFPAATHVKAYEAEVDSEIGVITPVNQLSNISAFK